MSSKVIPQAVDEEEIACFDRKMLSQQYLRSQVFLDPDLVDTIWSSLIFLNRSIAESNNSLKQLVVYVLVKCQDSFLTYERTAATVERRLRRRFSIGIGGHVNKNDEIQKSITDPFTSSRFNHYELLRRAAMRELTEEIEIDSNNISKTLELISFINDESDVVGIRHFGLVWQMELSQPDVKPKEKSGVGKVTFLDIGKLRKMSSSLESWSKLIVRQLGKP